MLLHRVGSSHTRPALSWPLGVQTHCPMSRRWALPIDLALKSLRLLDCGGIESGTCWALGCRGVAATGGGRCRLARSLAGAFSAFSGGSFDLALPSGLSVGLREPFVNFKC